jgi:predicted RNase H-like nuclease (RuvC/YqgF family)
LYLIIYLSKTEAERLLLYKKCEELATSELTLRSQVTVYAERYEEFQNAIQQSNQMVTTCHAEIEKMKKKIKILEKERNDFRHQWEIAEQNQRKTNEDVRIKKLIFTKKKLIFYSR